MSGSAIMCVISRIATINLDHALVNALVDRGCWETHTFRLLVGEGLVTLQDVVFFWNWGLTDI